jgi:PAS domain S-box-containing protein
MPTHGHDRSREDAVDLEVFFSLSIDMLCIAGYDGYFKHVNPAWERTLGWTVEEMTTTPWSDFVHPDDLESTTSAAAQQTEQGLEVISFENRYRAKDGSYHWLLWNSRPSAERQEMHAIARDITLQKEAQRALLDLNATLEQQVDERTAAAEARAEELTRKNAELEAFTYSISHDLKEPLRGIEAFSQFVIEDYSERLDDQGRDYLQKIAHASARMKRLIEDLLTLSRIGRTESPRQRVDVSRALRDIVAGTKTAIEARGATVDIAPDLPAVIGDSTRVEQIFGNLISNGLKFNRSDQPLVEVGWTAHAPGVAAFCVSDNGIGIDPQYHERIFGVFQRLHRREEFEGTGAGLSIARRAVEVLGGQMWVESEPGAGSTFWFTLPLAEDHVASQAA